MGCNCKKTYNIMSKYSDNPEELANEKENPIVKLFAVILQVIFGAIIGCIVLIFIFPLLIYVTLCLMTGREPSIRLTNPKNWFKRKE